MNRSLIRLIVPCLVAAAVLGAVTTASASAEACTKKAGSSVALCIEGQKTEGSLASLAQASTSATLKLPGAWPTMEWVCSKVSVARGGEFIPAKTKSGEETIGLDFTPTWSGCTTKAGPNVKCVMPTEDKFLQQPGIFEKGAGKDVVESIDLVEFYLENKSPTEICQTIRGYHHVAGHYECKFQEPEVEATAHELICESGGNESGTRIEEKPVSLKYALKVEFRGYANEGKKFSVYEY